MKITTTAFSNFTKIIWWTLLVISLAIAVLVFYLAASGDTTMLGDPYYEDQILAPQRAFGPWALSLFGVAIIIVLRIVTALVKRKRQTKTQLSA